MNFNPQFTDVTGLISIAAAQHFFGTVSLRSPIYYHNRYLYTLIKLAYVFNLLIR